jgi:hypothetical protein
MQRWFFDEISKGLSAARLEVYRQDGQNDFEVLCKYVWNQRLCEAAYPVLETLEVSLRNSIDGAAAQRFGALWFDNAFLDTSERVEIQKAKEELKSAGKPYESGRVIAALSFGFWTSLFASHYDRPLWHHVLRNVFPHLPPGMRTRAALSAHLQKIRKFRNRVFHHERITHTPRLLVLHADITETITWMNPHLTHLLSSSDRFPDVFRGGWASVQRDLLNCVPQLNGLSNDAGALGT